MSPTCCQNRIWEWATGVSIPNNGMFTKEDLALNHQISWERNSAPSMSQQWNLWAFVGWTGFLEVIKIWINSIWYCSGCMAFFSRTGSQAEFWFASVWVPITIKWSDGEYIYKVHTVCSAFLEMNGPLIAPHMGVKPYRRGSCHVGWG